MDPERPHEQDELAFSDRPAGRISPDHGLIVEKIRDDCGDHPQIAWIALALIVVVTLGPINLRPTTPFGPDFERFAAFVVFGAVFSLTYPKRLIYVAALIVVSCGVFEHAQHFIPDRHADFGNFLIKIAGAAVGIAGAVAIR